MEPYNIYLYTGVYVFGSVPLFVCQLEGLVNGFKQNRENENGPRKNWLNRIQKKGMRQEFK